MKDFKKTASVAITLIAVLICACVISFVTLCISGARPGSITADKEELEVLSPAQLGRTDDYGDIYIKSMVFVGDKTIYAMKDANVLHDNSLIWSGIGGSLALDYNTKTASLIYNENGDTANAADAAAIFKPQYMTITLALENGVEHCSEERFKEYYKNLISSIQASSPETKLILQSVFPVSKKVERNSPSISNDKIDRANIWIAEVADEMSIKYLNTAEVLKDSKGKLNTKYDSGDGICLNKEGYEAVLSYIRCHGYKS